MEQEPSQAGGGGGWEQPPLPPIPLPPQFPSSLFPSHRVLTMDSPRDFTPHWTPQHDVVLGPCAADGSLSPEIPPCPTPLPSSPSGLGASRAPGWGQGWEPLRGLGRGLRAERSRGGYPEATGSFGGVKSRGGRSFQPATDTRKHRALPCYGYFKY